MSQVVEGTLTTFGPQSLSTKPSSAKAAFGTSGRSEKLAEKPFEFKRLGATSTGVTTEVKSGFGSQALTQNQTSPSIGFGNKYASDGDMVKEGRPGPGAYEHTESVGKQVLSPNPTAPESRIGTGNRFAQHTTIFKPEYATPAAGNPRPTSGWLGDKPQYSFHGGGKRSDVSKGPPGQKPTYVDDPGPGAYDPNQSSLFAQVDSRKATAQRTRLGTADRDVRYKQYVSRAHEVDLFGKHSPAPNMYNPDMKMSSRARTPQSFGFGSGDRFSQVKSKDSGRDLKVWTPGPGAYTV